MKAPVVHLTLKPQGSDRVAEQDEQLTLVTLTLTDQALTAGFKELCPDDSPVTLWK